MRRFSLFLAVTALLLVAGVGYTLRLRLAQAHRAKVENAPPLEPRFEAKAVDWRWQKDDPDTGHPVVRVVAKSFEATRDPSTFELHDLALRLFNNKAESYTYIKSDKALFDERSGLLNSEGPVLIVMNVPADADAENPKEQAKRVRVTTSGVHYETKTGKATTDRPASFQFTEGDGQSVGAEYDPNTKTLHLKSQVALNWLGHGPAANKMHIETADLVYKETEQKVYLTPWSKLQRQGTTIQSQNTVVTLEDGRLHQVDGDRPFGEDVREDRRTDYSGDKMTALFDEDGNLVNIVAQNNAKVGSSQPSGRTQLTGNRADLRFAVRQKQVGADVESSSDLHLVLADGHAVAESVPARQPGVHVAETRILRSEHIELEMKPGGKDVQEIRAPTLAQLEFKPNETDQSHRVVDCSRLTVVYGQNSYVDTFQAWNAATHTDKPAVIKAGNKSDAGSAPPAAPALTWSDEMVTKFAPNSNSVAAIEQTGNFRYEEGARKAWAKKAKLEQAQNRITLTDSARVLDDTGSAVADTIVMNQANGDMDAAGHVVSTHEADKNEKPGTSMLDATKSMQAQADQMHTRDNNTRVHYEGRAIMWQGANRIAADQIDIDRDGESLAAKGNVVSELVDNKPDNAQGDQAAGAPKAAASAASAGEPIFTVVRAPELFYRDDMRVAHYTGGVKLTRAKMTITAKELIAYLNPKTGNGSDGSSLNHATASGDVTISDWVDRTRKRTGTAEHCDYLTAENKVVLTGGAPRVVDSYKGLSRGQKLTYYEDDDRLVVEGEKKVLAYTSMKKK